MTAPSTKPTVLLQIDADGNPSVFDSIVAVDSGVDHLLRFGNVEPFDVQPLVHGAIFTRGRDDLRHTAIFIGGTDVRRGEDLYAAVQESFFGPMRVSVMMDANGSSTTAAAAVLRMAEKMPLAGKSVAIFGSTGPVGRRVARLVSDRGARVFAVSRSSEKANELCAELNARAGRTAATPVGMDEFPGHDLYKKLETCEGVIAAGAAGVNLIPAGGLAKFPQLKVAIDLNAVPPAGIEEIQTMDNGRQEGSAFLFGAIAIGGLKMKIHKRCVRSLFETNDRLLDVDAICKIGEEITSAFANSGPVRE